MVPRTHLIDVTIICDTGDACFGAMRNLSMRDDGAFCEYLLMQAGVAVVAGSSFGAPGHMRLSFACSRQMLEKAVERIRAALPEGAKVKTA